MIASINSNLSLLSFTGCGKKIVTTWVDGKKHGFDETFNNDGELIHDECFQAGVKAEPSVCNEELSQKSADYVHCFFFQRLLFSQ